MSLAPHAFEDNVTEIILFVKHVTEKREAALTSLRSTTCFVLFCLIVCLRRPLTWDTASLVIHELQYSAHLIFIHPARDGQLKKSITGGLQTVLCFHC